MGPLTFRVSSELVQDHRPAAPVAMTGGFLTSRGPEGELDLFHVITDGPSKGGVRNVQRHPHSPTGWRQCDLPATFEAGRIAARVHADGKHVVFASADHEYGIALYASAETEPGQWSAWRDLEAGKHAPQDRRITALAAEVLDDGLQLFAIVASQPGKPYRPRSLWRIAWNESSPEWTEICETAGDFVACAKFAPTGAGLLTTVANGSGGTDLVHVNVATGERRVVAPDVAFRLIDVEEKRNGTSIVVFDDAAGERKPLRFIDGDDPQLTPRELPGTGQIEVRQILAIDGARLPYAVYVLDERDFLHVIHRDRDTGWEKRLNLGFRFTEISGGLNADGLPEIFGLTPGPERRLESIYKAPSDEEGISSWRRQVLSIEAPKLEVRPSYVTQIAVMDATGLPKPLTTVDVYASEQVEAVANGRAYVIGTTRPAAVTTDAAGRVTLIAATTALGAVKWQVREHGATGAGPWIDANDQVCRRMKTVTLENVRGLLPDDKKGEAPKVFDAVKQATSAVAFDVAIRSSGGYRLLPPGDVEEGGWSFSDDGTTTAFALLSRDEADAARAAILAGEDVQRLPLLRWFSDAAQAIANQVANAVKYVVKRVAEGIQATFEMLIDGICFVFDGILRFVEQVFQVVESIFNALQVAFEKLFAFFGRLLDDFRQDVWKTKEFLARHFDDSVARLLVLLDRSRDGIDPFLRKASSDIDAQFAALRRALEGKKFSYHSVAEGGPYPEETLMASSALLESVTRKVVDVAGSAQPPIAFSETLRRALTKLAEDFGRFAEKVKTDLGASADEQFRVIKEWLAGIAENPSGLARQSLLALADTIRNFARLVLNVSGATLGLLFDLAKTFLKTILPDVLRTKVGSPLLQAIYDAMNPNAARPLTVGDLLALMLAVPVSVGHWILTGKGFMAPAGPEHERGAATFAGVAPDEKGRFFVGGILRVVVVAPIDALLVLVPPLPIVKFVLSTGLFFQQLVQMPSSILDWSEANILPNVHFLASVMPPGMGAITAWADDKGVMAATFGIALGTLGILRIISDLGGGKFDLLSVVVWLIGPIPVIAGPIKEAGPKGKVAVILFKLFGHGMAGGALAWQNRGRVSFQKGVAA